MLLGFSVNVFPFILLGCKWFNIICSSFSICIAMFWLFFYRWYVTLSSTSLLCFCWIWLGALPGCAYCVISYFLTFTKASYLFLTCRRWSYILWFIICSIIEMYFVLAQFVCGHPQLCSFLLFWFILMLHICDQFVSSIHQHHIDVPLNVSSLQLFCSKLPMSLFIRKRYVILLYHSLSDEAWLSIPSN